MSSSGARGTNKGTLKLVKFNKTNVLHLKEMVSSIVYKYVENLHALIKAQDKKLKKYKNMINKLVKNNKKLKENRKEQNVLDPPDGKPFPNGENLNQPVGANIYDTKDVNSITSQAAFSFVDEMRQVAQQAENISNFIFEPTSGLYYDKKSGYYYNAEYGLYYDGNTGCYYNYNQKKNCYEFHSQVHVQATPSSTKEDGKAEDNVDEVVFDEFGVVTDRKKLNRLRWEKEHKILEKEHKHEKKLSENVNKCKELKHGKIGYMKNKRSRKHDSFIGSDSESEIANKKRPTDFDDGELSTSTSSSDSKSESEGEKRQIPSIFKSVGHLQDIAKKYPPSLRLVVLETNLESVKVGNLSLITFKGGSLGREGNHDVIIPDLNVSKFHLKFLYDMKNSIYKCVDLGSRNGTILNGTRMSVSKTESNLYDLVHGSVIQIAQTKLLCHIHEGNSTCGLCEPGLLIETQQREVSPGSVLILSHKEQLKKIQKKYGLGSEKYFDSKCNTANIIIGMGGSTNSYKDRAATRRLKVGSSTNKEKTQTSSMDTAISSDNRGFRMLSKLGWNKGECLGKSQYSGGLLEPINVNRNDGHKGLGCDDPTTGLILTASDKNKIELIKKTKERYEEAGTFSHFNDGN